MSSFFFVDSRVGGVDALLPDLGPDFRVVLLNTETGDISQIVAALAGETDLDAIHILSHGSPGTLYLGASEINEAALDEYQQELVRIGSTPSESGDILLYGCNVAGGEVGADFIAKLSAYTGAISAIGTEG